MNPFKLLSEAIKAVPAMKYALAAAGLFAAIAIVASFKIDLKIAIWGAVILIGLMVILLLFAKLSSFNGGFFSAPAKVFVWAMLILFILTALGLFTSVFFHWPLSFSKADTKVSEAQPVVRNPENEAAIKKLYPRLEKLIAIYSILAWRSPSQTSVNVAEDYDFGQTKAFNLNCNEFQWSPYEKSKPGQLFNCFKEETSVFIPETGENIKGDKLAPNGNVQYSFDYELLLNYKTTVTVNPPPETFKELYKRKKMLDSNSACLTENQNYANKESICGFKVYVIELGNLLKAGTTSFLASDGYLTGNPDGSYTRSDDWVVYIDGSEYIEERTLNKFIQLLLRQLHISEINLSEAVVLMRDKLLSDNPPLKDYFLQTVRKDTELSTLVAMLN